MKTKDKVVFTYILLLLTFGSCSKKTVDYFEETAEGRGSLAFTIEGSKIHQQDRAWLLSSAYRREAKYNVIEESSTVEIYANLNSKKFVEMHIWLPLEDVYSGSTLQADSVALYFLYLPRIIGPSTWEPIGDGPGMVTIHETLREGEYRKVNITESKISIRKWSPDELILAGNFIMSGNYADSTGKEHGVLIKDGVFDLTNSYVPK